MTLYPQPVAPLFAQRRLVALLAFGALVLGFSLTGCGGAPPVEPPNPDVSEMESQVGAVVRRARDAVVESPEDGDAWGELGMVLHVHELYDDAEIAYRQAAEVDPDDERWPYFLGDVLAVRGDDPEAAFAAYRRALEIRDDYAPAHLRFANALAVEDRLDEAETSYRRAVELDADLLPAVLGLAQVLLRQGDAEAATPLLEKVVRLQPSNPRALSALGRAYQQLGRRDEALAVAERARGPEVPSFFDDPLMAQVQAKAASTTLLWDRARAYLDAGNYLQAAAGLERVVQRRPDDVDAHLQFATALRELDRPTEAARHLARALELEPDRSEIRVQLAIVLLDLGRGDAALAELRRAAPDRPDDVDLPWLVARAHAVAERHAEAVAAFEQAAASAGKSSPPTWAESDWGAALARLGRYSEAIDHFETALAADPRQPQTLVFLGLAREATGDVDAAVEAYRRAQDIEPNPVAADRLRALGNRD